MTTFKPPSAALSFPSRVWCRWLSIARNSDRWFMTVQNFVTEFLLALYACQTAAEQGTKATKDMNHVGFTAWDAPTLTKFAERLLAGESLSQAEEEVLRFRLKKYWGQFCRLNVPGGLVPPASISAQSVTAENVDAEKERLHEPGTDA